jgi:hypothetical protein
MGQAGYKKNPFFAYISNCKLTFVTECTYKRKTAREFSVYIEFFKNALADERTSKN